jgi:hypothetical protein
MVRRTLHFAKEAQILAQTLEEGSASRTFQLNDPEETAETLIWATNSLLPYSLTPKELGRKKDIEDLVSRIADLLIGGLISKNTK